MAMPARRSTVLDVPCRRAVDSTYTMASAPSDPAKLDSGTTEMPRSVKSMWNVMASMVPSVAPAETPSVSGDASGFLSSAWKTAPESARPLPTIAAAD